MLVKCICVEVTVLEVRFFLNIKLNSNILFYTNMHHGPTELDDTLRAFEELSVSIVDLTVANICFTGSASRRQ